MMKIFLPQIIFSLLLLKLAGCAHYVTAHRAQGPEDHYIGEALPSPPAVPAEVYRDKWRSLGIRTYKLTVLDRNGWASPRKETTIVIDGVVAENSPYERTVEDLFAEASSANGVVHNDKYGFPIYFWSEDEEESDTFRETTVLELKVLKHE